MPSAIQIGSKTEIRPKASPLVGVFILALGWVINLCVIDAAFAHNHGEAKHILYINSYHPGYSWSDDIQKGLTQRLQTSDLEIEFSVEYLDSRRFNKPALQDKQADILLTKYSGYRFDLLVVSDNAAFQFAVGNRGLLFAGVPVVFCGYNNFRPEILHGFSDITGVNEEMDIDSLIKTALFIQPKIRTLVFILSTGDASSKAIAERIETSIILNTATNSKYLSKSELPN